MLNTDLLNDMGFTSGEIKDLVRFDSSGKAEEMKALIAKPHGDQASLDADLILFMASTKDPMVEKLARRYVAIELRLHDCPTCYGQVNRKLGVAVGLMAVVILVLTVVLNTG